MHILSLRLHDFRSYRQVMLSPPKGATVFVGENGAGKTNLLEAVHLCCLGRSHRTSADKEMIREGQETAAVQVKVQREDGVDEVGVRLYSPAAHKRKVLYINGKTASRTGELMGHVTCVMFSPEDLDIVRGAPQGADVFWICCSPSAARAIFTRCSSITMLYSSETPCCMRSSGAQAPPRWMRGTSSCAPPPCPLSRRGSTPCKSSPAMRRSIMPISAAGRRSSFPCVTRGIWRKACSRRRIF